MIDVPQIASGKATNTTAKIYELNEITESTKRAVEKFNEQYRAKHGTDSDTEIKLYEGTFTPEERQNFATIAKSIKDYGEKSGTNLNIAIIETSNPDIHAFRDGNTVFLTKDELMSGNWARHYGEELGHFINGSQNARTLANFLAGETGTPAVSNMPLWG